MTDMEGLETDGQDGESQQATPVEAQLPSPPAPTANGQSDAPPAQQQAQQAGQPAQNATPDPQLQQATAQNGVEAGAEQAPAPAPSQPRPIQTFEYVEPRIIEPLTRVRFAEPYYGYYHPKPADAPHPPPGLPGRPRKRKADGYPVPQPRVIYPHPPPRIPGQAQPPQMQPPPPPQPIYHHAYPQSPSAMGFPAFMNPAEQQTVPPSAVAGLRTVVDGLTVEACTQLLSEMTDAQRREMLCMYAEAKPQYGDFLRTGFNQNIGHQNKKIMFFDEMVDSVAKGLRARCARDKNFDIRAPSALPVAHELFDRLIEPTVRTISANSMFPAKEETKRNAMISLLDIVFHIADTPLFQVEPGLGVLRDRPLLEMALLSGVRSIAPPALSRVFRAPHERPGNRGSTTVRESLHNCIDKCAAIGAMPQLREVFLQLGGDPSALVIRKAPVGPFGMLPGTQPVTPGSERHRSMSAQTVRSTSQVNGSAEPTSAPGATRDSPIVVDGGPNGSTPVAAGSTDNNVQAPGDHVTAPASNAQGAVTDITMLNDDQIDDIAPGPVEKFDSQVSQIEIDYYNKYAHEPTDASGYAVAATIEDAWGHIGKRSGPGSSYATRRNAAFAYTWIVTTVAQAGGALEERVRKGFGPSAAECIAVFQELVDGLRPSERRKLLGEKYQDLPNAGTFEHWLEIAVKAAQEYGVFEGIDKCLEALRRVPGGE